MVETALETQKKRKIFYGYWVLAVGFICLMFQAGCNVYSFGLFVKPLEVEFGWGRASIMWANTISTLATAFSGLFVGRIIDRYNPKLIIVTGAVVATSSYISLYFVRELWQLYLLYGLSGAGFAAVGFMPISSIIFNWFKKRRGTAIGLSGVGIGVGGFIIPLLLGNYLLPVFGWRISWLVLGLAVSFIVIPLTLLVIKARPEDIGLHADGILETDEETRTKSTTGKVESGVSFSEAVKTLSFWLIALTGTVFGFGSHILISHQAAHLQDIGFPVAIAASALGAVGIANAATKFCFGVICDIIRPKYGRALGLFFLVVAVIMLIRIGPSTSVPVVWLYAVMVGLCMGSWLPSMTMLVSTSFGLFAYGTIFSVVGLFNQLGSSTGPVIAGYLFDTQGDYRLAFTLVAVLSAIAVIATLFIRSSKEYEARKRH